MNFDVRKNAETQTSINSIESKISRVMNEIEKEFSFKWNTLESLMAFKLEKQKATTIEKTVDFKSSLIEEIKQKANAWEITSSENLELSQAKYEVLANKIIELNKLKNEVQSEIQNLRAEYLKSSLENFQIGTNDFITRKWYSKATLARIENPQSMTDEMLGLAISWVESIVTIGKFSFDVLSGVVLTPYHLVKIVSGKAKYDWVEI